MAGASGIFWYTQSRPLSAQRVHRGIVLSHRLLPRTHALQLFCRDADAAAEAADVDVRRSIRRMPVMPGDGSKGLLLLLLLFMVACRQLNYWTKRTDRKGWMMGVAVAKGCPHAYVFSRSRFDESPPSQVRTEDDGYP
jgi:hypothetical protein